jgi:hypothetical protein
LVFGDVKLFFGLPLRRDGVPISPPH